MLPVFTDLVDINHKGQNNHPGRGVITLFLLTHHTYMPATIVLYHCISLTQNFHTNGNTILNYALCIPWVNKLKYV